MGKREQIVAYCRKQLGCAYSYTPSGGSHSGTTYDFSRAAYMRVACNLIDGSSAIYVE